MQRLHFKLPVESCVDFIDLGKGGGDLGQLLHLLFTRDGDKLVSTPGTGNLLNNKDCVEDNTFLAATLWVKLATTV